jgi:hypothetical protein
LISGPSSSRSIYVIDPTRSGDVAEDILGLDYDGTMIHDVDAASRATPPPALVADFA